MTEKNETEKIGSEIFRTDVKPGEEKAAAAPPPPPQVPPVKTDVIFPPKKGTNWLNILMLLFVISSLCGLYIIFSKGSSSSADQSFETRVAPPSLGSMARSTVSEGAAVIRIRGIITESMSSGGWREPASASSIAKRIRDTADRSEVKAIILDINSPGGTIGATQDIYNAIIYARTAKNKPVIALMRDLAASGAYYISAGCDKIVAQPGTLTGSIGVIIQVSNFEGLMQKVGVKFDNITSGPHKDMGSATRPMTPEERALMQAIIDDGYAQFYEAVSQGRPSISQTNLKMYADGRVFTGRQALELGFVDALGGEEKALEIASELSGVKDIKVITTLRSTGFWDWLSSLSGDTSSSTNLKQQVESFTTPRVAYLWSL